jgi:hypothetical protein
MNKRACFGIILLLMGLIPGGSLRDVSAQEVAPDTGSLVVTVPVNGDDFPQELSVNYTQISHDFLIGYDGPTPKTGLPGSPNGFNLVLKCIPWAEIEPTAGSFPHISEEIQTGETSSPEALTGNDCLLFFGEDGPDGLPDDVKGLAFDALMERVQVYLEHAVRYESSQGINLFVIKEPAYPSIILQSLTPSQWLKLIKLACQTIRAQAPRANIVIEIIPQYLPGLGYKPYTFLNNLILDGVSFDGVMMVFSRPIASYVSKTGYPHMNWVNAQVDIFSDLGKQMYVRFSGVPLVGPESDRQVWLEEMYAELFSRQTVVGIYWDEVKLFPPKLFDVSWPATPAVSPASSGITTPILTFISDRTSSGVIEADASGQAVIYGYAGEYEIRIEGIADVIRAHIYRGQERHLNISLLAKDTVVEVGKITPTGQPQSSGDNGIATPTLIGMGIAFAMLFGLGVGVWKKEHGIVNGKKNKR